MSDNVRFLADAQEKQRLEHAAKCRKMFEEHPELFEEAIIIVSSAQITLTPQWMGQHEIVGTLEAAKLGVLMAAYMEPEGG